MAITVRHSEHKVSGIGSLGGTKVTSPEGILPPNSGLHSLWDHVLKHESIAGSTEYRCIYICNETTSTMYGLKIKFISVPSAATISIGALNKNTQAESITNESTKPSGVVFKNNNELDSESSGYLVPPNAQELAPGEYIALWMERKVTQSSGSGTIIDEYALSFSYRT